MKKFLISNISSALFNLFLLFFLLISIQNNQYKKKINFMDMQTVPLPISFIIGTSFITGSLYSNLISSILKFNK